VVGRAIKGKEVGSVRRVAGMGTYDVIWAQEGRDNRGLD
jgi:hypothetical protein